MSVLTGALPPCDDGLWRAMVACRPAENARLAEAGLIVGAFQTLLTPIARPSLVVTLHGWGNFRARAR